MTTRTTWPVAALALLVLALPAAAPASKRPKPPCSARYSETLASTPTARMYVTEDQREVYGCLKRLGKRFRLFVYEECFHVCEDLAMPRLAGNYAAFVDIYDFSYGGGAPDEHRRSVRVFDLRTGREVREAEVDPTVLLLSPGGTAVTLAGTAGNVELALHWTFGSDRVLDRGAIDPRSVTIDGPTVRWTKAGVPSAAPLRAS
jgi:hypothetical protein